MVASVATRKGVVTCSIYKAATMVHSLFVHEYSAAWLDCQRENWEDNIGVGCISGYVIGANTANRSFSAGRDATSQKQVMRGGPTLEFTETDHNNTKGM